MQFILHELNKNGKYLDVHRLMNYFFAHSIRALTHYSRIVKRRATNG